MTRWICPVCGMAIVYSNEPTEAGLVVDAPAHHMSTFHAEPVEELDES
jgi:hypothetical protein